MSDVTIRMLNRPSRSLMVMFDAEGQHLIKVGSREGAGVIKSFDRNGKIQATCP